MNRIFGTKKKKKEAPPAMSLDEVSSKMDKKSAHIDTKIAQLDKQILVLKKKMKNSRGAAKARYKNQALQLLKRRKMYDQQAGIIGQQQFNVDQMSFTMDSIKDTQTVVATMKETAKTMKTQFEELNIDEVDDLYDDMEDLMDDASEINEIMGRNMGNMDEIDDDELEAELDGLDDDLLDDLENDEAPNYLDEDSMPVVNAQETVNNDGADGGKKETDEFGLPIAAQ